MRRELAYNELEDGKLGLVRLGRLEHALRVLEHRVTALPRRLVAESAAIAREEDVANLGVVSLVRTFREQRTEAPQCALACLRVLGLQVGSD